MSEPIRRLGKYEILGEIGKGGFATVYRAHDLELGRDVALKILDPLLTRDPVWVARFRREARAVASLDHPRIVTIHEIGQAEGVLFIAMKLIDGGSLAQHLAQNGRVSWGEAVRLVGEIAAGLDYAHGQGVVHRDLKPANVLLDSRTGAVLTDFGFARLVADNSMSISMSGGVVGTPAYIAPEVWEGQEPTPQADIYALGCMVYEMIAGRPLFTGATPPAVMLAHFKPPALPETWPEDVPSGVSELLATALDKDPTARFTRAGDFAAALANLVEDELAEPYAALQAAIAAQKWPEAMALAGEIRAKKADYRDVVALERQAAAGTERAARAQSASQWRATAEEALAAGDLAGAQVAVKQWQQLTPDDPELANVRERLHVQQASAASVAAARSVKSQVASPPPPPIVPPVSPASAERQPTGGRGVWLLLAGVGALAAIVVLVLALRGGDKRPATSVAVVEPAATSTVMLLPTRTPVAPADTPVPPTLEAIATNESDITSSGWPSQGHDAARTGYNSVETELTPPLRQLWAMSIDGYVADSITVSEGKVALAGGSVVGNKVNQVSMLDASTGAVLWDFKLTGGGGELMGVAPAFGEGLVFFGGQGDSKLYAIDVVTGNVVWERSGLSSLYSSQLAVVGDRLYVPDETYGIVALQASTGVSLWGRDSAGASGFPVALSNDVVFGLEERSGRSLVALNAQSGETKWQFSGPVSDRFPLIMAGDEQIYFKASDTEVIAANIRDGSVAWRTTLGAEDVMTGGGSAALANNILYVGVNRTMAGNSGLAAIDVVTGKILWTFSTKGEGWMSVAVANGVIYTMGSEALSELEASTLYALDPVSGEVLWSSPLDGVGIASAIADGVLFVTAIKGVNGNPEGSIVYAFGAESSSSDTPVTQQTTTGGQQVVTGVPKVGIVLPTKDELYWSQNEARFKQLFDAAGIPVEILFSQGDSAKEKAIVESLLTKGVKVLILTSYDGAAAAAAADEAKAAGAKVISYGTLVLGTDAVDYCVLFDRNVVGELQGQYLVEKATGTGNPLYLYAGAAYDPTAFLYFEGAWKVLQPKIADGTFVIKNSSEASVLKDKVTLTHDEMVRIFDQISIANWDPNAAKDLVEANLSVVNPDDKGNVFVLAPEDFNSRVIAGAFAADKDVKNYVVTGLGANKASIQDIIDGKPLMTILADFRILADDATNAALAYLEGKTPPHTKTYNNGKIDVPAKPSTMIVVDKENVKAAIIDSGYYPASEFTGLQ